MFQLFFICLLVILHQGETVSLSYKLLHKPYNKRYSVFLIVSIIGTYRCLLYKLRRSHGFSIKNVNVEVTTVASAFRKLQEEYCLGEVARAAT